MSDDDPDVKKIWLTRRWVEYARQMGRSEKDGKYYEVPIHPNCRENIMRCNKYYTTDQDDEWLKPQHVVGAVRGSRTHKKYAATFGCCPKCFQAGPLMAVCAKCTSIKDKMDRNNRFLFSHIMAVGEGRNSGKILDAEWLAKQVGAPVLWPYADRLVCCIKDEEYVYRQFDASFLAMDLFRAWKLWQEKGWDVPVTLEAQKLAYFHAAMGDPDAATEIVFNE
jgi:hypothetical protein